MTRKHWHPAFCGATEWELKDNKNDLLFEPEHLLNKEPIRTDLLIIKKNPEAKIKNEIGRIFRQHNIIEYKGTGRPAKHRCCVAGQRIRKSEFVRDSEEGSKYVL